MQPSLSHDPPDCFDSYYRPWTSELVLKGPVFNTWRSILIKASHTAHKYIQKKLILAVQSKSCSFPANFKTPLGLFNGLEEPAHECAAFVCFVATLNESQVLSFGTWREKETVASNGNKIAWVKAFPPTAPTCKWCRWIVTPCHTRQPRCSRPSLLHLSMRHTWALDFLSFAPSRLSVSNSGPGTNSGRQCGNIESTWSYKMTTSAAFVI